MSAEKKPFYTANKIITENLSPLKGIHHRNEDSCLGLTESVHEGNEMSNTGYAPEYWVFLEELYFKPACIIIK